ncbi:TIGR03016 family PEP-CTERM system-associated outer membrane protein [Leptothrix sp. BB-4]
MATTTRAEARRRSGLVTGLLLLGCVLAPAQAQVTGQQQNRTPAPGTLGRDGLPFDPALAVDAPTPAGVSQSVKVRPSVQLRSTTTNNISLSTGSAARADTVVVATPRLDVRINRPGLKVDAALASDLVTYVGRSRADRILPNARADTTVQLAERLLFLDATLSADSSTPTPFGLLDVPSQTVYTRGTTTRERISPYVTRELGTDGRIELRTDHSWVQNPASAGQLGNATLSQQTGLYELRPQPLGLRVDGQRQASSFSGSAVSDVTFETARGSLLYAAVPQQLLLIVSGGRDHGKFGSNDLTETLRGGGFIWTPSERTRLDALAEKRFFGTGWNVNFTHRSPFMAVNGSLRQGATTYAAQVAALPAGADLVALLDSMLATRIPNPADRAAAVEQLIAQRNLPTTLGSPLNLYSTTAQLQKGGDLSVALLGVRHTVTLRMFYSRIEDLLGKDLPPLVSSNARQMGSTLGLSRRLRPETTADFSLGRTLTVGLGTNAGTQTETNNVRLGLSESFSPRTTGSISLNRLWVNSTLLADANQTSISFGLLHRF